MNFLFFHCLYSTFGKFRPFWQSKTLLTWDNVATNPILPGPCPHPVYTSVSLHLLLSMIDDSIEMLIVIRGPATRLCSLPPKYARSPPPSLHHFEKHSLSASEQPPPSQPRTPPSTRSSWRRSKHCPRLGLLHRGCGCCGPKQCPARHLQRSDGQRPQLLSRARRKDRV